MYPFDIEKENISKSQLLILIAIAYVFSVAIRMIWVYYFKDELSFYWNGQLMINTNDGYFFAAGAQQALFGLHENSLRIPNWLSYGVTFFTVILTKITPFSLETVILYMPSFISSLVVIPMILIARLFKVTSWGFFAALLGSVAWSYYNRTMTGYYDTDMFAAMAPMFVLYFFMASVMNFTLKSAVYASFMIIIYPFLYDQGNAVVFAMALIYFAYLLVYHFKESNTYKSIVLVSLSTLPVNLFVPAPYNYLVSMGIVYVVYLFIRDREIEKKTLYVVSAILVIMFLYFGNLFGLIIWKMSLYLSSGTQEEGLHYYSVFQTVREAAKIPFFHIDGQSCVSERVIGSGIGFVLAVIGYILLVLKHRAFILALPLIGIGIFAHWGGLRFTVYAVPVAALSVIYLVYLIAEQVGNKAGKYLFVFLATSALLYPNLKHIIEYRVPTVMTKDEVSDLDKLKSISNDTDYTVAWWDYGYPIAFYSNTNTLIDGSKHGNDNFIVSKILQTSSQNLAANLSRLVIESYVDKGGIAAATLFKDKNPNELLDELSVDGYRLPQKTRDIYLYLPYRMMNIFPTVAVFGNMDLTTGKPLRKIEFYPTNARSDDGKGIISLANGIVIDAAKGLVNIGPNQEKLKYFIVATAQKDGSVERKTQQYSADGAYSVIYMPSYRRFVVMDSKTLESTYVQMFILGKYDKNLFELLQASPYSKIYKLKR